MQRIIKNLQIWRVLKFDSYTTHYYFIPAVFLCMYIVDLIFYKIFGTSFFFHITNDKDNLEFFYYIALFTAICLIGIILRFYQLMMLLNNHVLLKGKFIRLQSLDKGYSCITYHFHYQGKEYSMDKYIPRSDYKFPRNRKLNNGDELHLIINPKKPKRNLILEMYDINIA